MIFWKYMCLQSKGSSKGFTIPLVLGLGLFMLAISITAIKLSSSSEINSKIQEKTQQSLAAAELGLARIQEILDENRTIAVYNDCTVARVNGSCPDTANDLPSWANPGAINRESQSGESCLPIEDETNQIQIEAIASNTNWVDATPGNPSNGQYRLISYKYTPNSGVPYEFPGVAVLTVEGRSNQFESNASDPNSEVLNTGTTRLTVEVPIRKNTREFTTTVPGLWMDFSFFSDMGSNNVNGSILIADPDCSGGGAYPNSLSPEANITPGSGGTISATPQAMPDTPNLPPLNRLNKIQSKELFDVVIPREDENGVITDVTYEGAYHYLIPSLEQASGSSINISGNQTIIFYVQGPIAFNGSVNQRTGVTSDSLQIYGNTIADPPGSGYKVGAINAAGTYKYGCDQVRATNGNLVNNVCPTQTIKLTGTADLNAFIHAPDAWACVTGGGSDYSVTGALWIKQWIAVGSLIGDIAPAAVASALGNSCSTSNKNVIDFQGSSLPPLANDLLGADQIQYFDEPQVSSFTSWKRVASD